MAKLEEVPSIKGSNYGGVVFKVLPGAISRKRCKIEPRSQLITNRKSYMGF